VISYGIDRPADLRAEITEARADGSRARVTGRWGEAELWVPMAGAFNVSNALAAAAVGLRLDVSIERVAAALASGQQGVQAISQWVAEHAEELCATLRPPRRRALRQDQ